MSSLARLAASSRWRPAPFLTASAGLHLFAAVAVLAAPTAWAWALGVLAANHALLTAFGLWPRSRMLGPNLSRLPPASIARGEVALTFDDGPDPDVTPRVLDLLDAHQVRATFFCIAGHVDRHAALTREIRRRGHELENHSHGHPHTFALLGIGGIRRDIAAAQALIALHSGRTPRFFRSPMGFRNPLLDPVLHEMGLKLVSWTRRGFDTRKRDAAHIAQRLQRGLAAGDILLLHDGNCARTAGGIPVVLEVLPRLLDAIRDQGLKPVTLHQAIEP